MLTLVCRHRFASAFRGFILASGQKKRAVVYPAHRSYSATSYSQPEVNESMSAPLPAPELPHPAHVERESALGRKFGKEVVNYFGSSPLNRVSFLREDHDFIAGAFDHPSTKFLAFKNLSPLIDSPTEIHYLKYEDIKKVLKDTATYALFQDYI